MEDKQNRQSTGCQRDHARLVDHASPGTTIIRKDIENSGVTWEEALLLTTDRQE